MAGNSKNVLGEHLQPCSMNPRTGFFRDGCCKTGENDYGSHTVCVRVTEAFLLFSSKEGNDLSTPRPELQFPGSRLEINGVFAQVDGKRLRRQGVPLLYCWMLRMRRRWT